MLLLTSLHLTSTPLDKEDCYQRVRMLAGGEINDSFLLHSDPLSSYGNEALHTALSTKLPEPQLRQEANETSFNAEQLSVQI